MGLFDRFKKRKNVEVQEDVKVEASKVREASIEKIKREALEVEEPKAVEAPRSEGTKTEEVKAVEAPRAEEVKAEEVKAVEVPRSEEPKAVEMPRSEETKAEAADAGGKRRFTLLVEGISPLPQEQGVVVAGSLYGTLQKGDAIYMIHPMGNITTTRVEGIEVGQGQTADRAENQKITMLLKDVKNVNQVPKYTVLTSIKPQTTADVNTAVENPQLLGMSMDYPRLCKDNTYLNLLVYVICHAHYVVPVSVDKEPENNGDGAAVFRKETRMRFPSLQDPAEKSRNIFPVFTDWTALANWKNLFDEKHPPKSVIMRFPDVVSVCKGNGIVLNPFGPASILLSEKMIEQIVGMEGYKQEFGEKPAETVKKVHMEQEAKVVVGVPKEKDEIKMIKEAMIAQAKKEKEIQRVDFLLKVDMQKERAYLCIVDCPEEQAARLFTGLHKAAAPYFNEVKRLEFLLYGKTKLANDVVSEKSCIYQA